MRIPIGCACMIRVTVSFRSTVVDNVGLVNHLPISHHIGAVFSVLSRQIIPLMKNITQPMPHQKLQRTVPEFQAASGLIIFL